MSAVCKTEPDETEPTAVLPHPACGGGRIKEEEDGVVKEEEDGVVVKEEKEQERESLSFPVSDRHPQCCVF